MYKNNYCVMTAHKKSDFVRNVFAPFSALAHKAEGLDFFKRLRNNPRMLHEELTIATGAIIDEINGILPCIVSVADPYANGYTISEDDMLAFSLPYLLRLLRSLNMTKGGAVHICPYCSELMERLGLTRMERFKLPPAKTYAEVLSDYARAESGVLLGGQCIHTDETDFIFVLRPAADSA